MAMPAAWQAGYDWACGEGPFPGLELSDAIEAMGWDLDSPEAELFDRGVECAQKEQEEEYYD